VGAENPRDKLKRLRAEMGAKAASAAAPTTP